jgi:hypothetical protein
LGMKSLIFTFQVQNAAIWTQNKYHIDPTTVSNNGIVGMPLARQYSCSVNVGL